MPADDVVAELDDWLAREATTLKHYPADDVDTGLLQRARDEIVTLRGLLEHSDRTVITAVVVATPAIRDEALEEAATACLRKARDYVIPIGQDNYHDGCVSCAAAIRALKGPAR